GTTNALAGYFRLQVANGSDTVTEFPADLSTNAPYVVVTRYNIDTATTTLWLNPASESSSSVTASDSQTAATVVSYGFRQDTAVGATILIDDLRVGLSFADVIPGAAVSPIKLNMQLAGGAIVLSWSNAAF